MDLWLVWILLAAAFAAGEIATLGFFLAPFAVGALLAAGFDVAGAPEAASIAGFLVVSGLSFALLRPVARRHLNMPPSLRTGTDALIGKRAVVIERIANDEGVGCVKIDGEVWTARAYDEDDVIAEGTRVQVLQIRGATALVSE